MKALPIALLLVGCATEMEPEPTSHSVVLTELTFARADDGVSVGFDLDGQVTSPGSPDGCGQGDYTAPDGSEGVDNAIARLLPFLDTTEAVAVGPIIQQEINNGGLLLVLEMIGLDDPDEDAVVDLRLRYGTGQPQVGTDGFLVHGQTLVEDSAQEGATALDVAWSDGVLQADGFRVLVPVQVFDFEADFDIQDATLRLERDDEGWRGLFGGRVAWQGIMDAIIGTGIDDGLEEALPPLLDSLSDLRDDNGDCTLLSATLEFRATDVFLFDDE